MDAELREALQDIRNDIKKLLPMQQMVERHELLLYGNGHDGLITSVEKIKTRHRTYEKLLAGFGAVVTAVFGDGLWRHLK